MSFTTPIALLLLLLIPYFVWTARPSARRRGRWRSWGSLAVRVLIIVLLAMALAGAQMVQPNDTLGVVFLVDGSDSISAEQAARAEAFVRDSIATMGNEDEAAVVIFGANALVERPMSGLAELAPITSVPETLHSNLADAIRLGMALFPADSARRIVIVSDGAETTGDAAEAAKLAAAAGVPIDFYPLSRLEGGVEVMLTAVDAPTRIVEGETFRIDVTAESTRPMNATLRVLAGGQIIYDQTVQLTAGVNHFPIRLHATEPEFTRYRVQLTPDEDTYYQNNELAAFTEVVGSPRILLVANDGTIADDGTPHPDESVQLMLALEAAGLDVDRITPTQLPSNLGTLSSYASVILVNVNGKNLSPRKMETLQTYVRDLGGGLVVVGGAESYGMGGYYKTALEETLPVEMQIKDQERFPSVSIAIVIDRSGSMGAQEGGVTKIQLAAEGAVRVVELLNEQDEITVLPVDTQPDNPIGPMAVGDKEEAIALIRQIGAGGGGIYVRTGLEAAADALAQGEHQVKHIILLSDGSDSEQKEGVPELIEGLVASDITVSVVSIGDGPDTPWLREMAVLGNGRFHLTDQAANLPQIFTQETTNIQRSYLIEERFFPELENNSPILAGIRSVPPLYGYVGTSPKGTAQVVLNSHQGDPLLATWQYGLGRSVAWTSDATGRWASDWVQWEGFPAFWAQTVRWTISQERDSAVETAVSYTGDGATLTVDARDGDGGFFNNLQMVANIVAPDGTVENLAMQQIAPGRYQSNFAPTGDGAYFIRVAGGDGEEETAVGQTSGWVLGYSPEYQQFETNVPLLLSLAEKTNGRDLSALAETADADLPDGLVEAATAAVFSHDLPIQPAYQPIWMWLLLAAVLLLPLDIGLRRIVVTRRDWERAWAASFGRVLPARVVTEPAPRTEQVSRLFEAKKRAKGEQLTANNEQLTVNKAPPVVVEEKEKKQATVNRKRETGNEGRAKPSGSLAARLLAKKKEGGEGGG